MKIGYISRSLVADLQHRLTGHLDKTMGALEADHIRLGTWHKGELIAGYHGTINGQWLYNEMLWVNEEYRGQGIGKTLLQRAETTSDCQRALSLCVGESATMFNKVMGYNQLGSFINWRGRHPMTLLWKNL